MSTLFQQLRLPHRSLRPRISKLRAGHDHTESRKAILRYTTPASLTGSPRSHTPRRTHRRGLRHRRSTPRRPHAGRIAARLRLHPRLAPIAQPHPILTIARSRLARIVLLLWRAAFPCLPPHSSFCRAPTLAHTTPSPRPPNSSSNSAPQIRGEVRFDAASKALYATDALQLPPHPHRRRHPARRSRRHRHRRRLPPVQRSHPLSRSRHLPRRPGLQHRRHPRLLEVHERHGRPSIPVTRTVHVQPGIVLDRVRDAAEKFDLTFAPDPATHSRCTIGGMIGNNSCGVHALMGGKTVDNIHSLDLLLYDGTRLTVGPTTEAELAAHIAAGGRIGEIYAALKRIRDTYADSVRAKFPHIPRRVSGFNLDELLPENNFNVARALVGSEGTCAIILGATLNLVESPAVPHPRRRRLPRHLHRRRPRPRRSSTHKPIGLEGMDGLLLDALRRKQKSVDDLKLLPARRRLPPRRVRRRHPSRSRRQSPRPRRLAQNHPRQPTARIYTSDEAKRVWHIRESGLGATAFIPGSRHRLGGLGRRRRRPRTARHLPPRHLRPHARVRLLAAPCTATSARAASTCASTSTSKPTAGILKFRQFIDRAADIALAHGGSLSGEHGDGQARGALLPKMFGEELMEAFRAFKRIWDPTNRMNPGKLIDAHEPHEDLRLGADYKPWQPKTHFAFAEDNGSLRLRQLSAASASEPAAKPTPEPCAPASWPPAKSSTPPAAAPICYGSSCRAKSSPTNGRTSRSKSPSTSASPARPARSECPVSVDMATYKAEFLAHHYEGAAPPALPLRLRPHRPSAPTSPPSRPASSTPSTTPPSSAPSSRSLLHIHPNRTFPRFAKPFTPDRRLARDARRRRDRRNLTPCRPHPRLPLGRHLQQLLPPRHHARRPPGPHRPPASASPSPTQHLCCGRPLYDFGMLDTAKAISPQNPRRPHPATRRRHPHRRPRTKLRLRLPRRTHQPPPQRSPRRQSSATRPSSSASSSSSTPPTTSPRRSTEKIIVHGHCHHRATMGMTDETRPPPRHRSRGRAPRLRLLRHGRPLRLRKRQIRPLAKTRRARPPPRRPQQHPKPSSSPTASAAANRSPKTPHARPMHLAEVLAQTL